MKTECAVHHIISRIPKTEFSIYMNLSAKQIVLMNQTEKSKHTWLTNVERRQISEKYFFIGEKKYQE